MSIELSVLSRCRPWQRSRSHFSIAGASTVIATHARQVHSLATVLDINRVARQTLVKIERDAITFERHLSIQVAVDEIDDNPRLALALQRPGAVEIDPPFE